MAGGDGSILHTWGSAYMLPKTLTLWLLWFGPCSLTASAVHMLLSKTRALAYMPCPSGVDVFLTIVSLQGGISCVMHHFRRRCRVYMHWAVTGMN